MRNPHWKSWEVVLVEGGVLDALWSTRNSEVDKSRKRRWENGGHQKQGAYENKE